MLRLNKMPIRKLMKDVLTLEMLESYRKYLKQFITDLEICIDNIDKLIIAQSENINLQPIIYFLNHYVYLCYSNCSINIYKIFKSEEKRSFHKLFNLFKNSKVSADLSQLLRDNAENLENTDLVKSKKELLELVSTIEKEIDLKEVILVKIKTRREKYYAHTDPTINVKPETLTELKEIKELSIWIYNLLFGRIFNVHYMFSSYIACIQPIIEDRKFVDNFWKNEETKLE